MENEEINKDVVLQDVYKIMVHLSNVNKELQKAYIILANVIKEATKQEDNKDGNFK